VPPVERFLHVRRTARYFLLGDPGPATRELWVACHGYGQLAEPFVEALEPLLDPARVIVAPEGLSRFYLDEPAKRHGPESPVGASWMTREDRLHEIEDYVAYLDAVTEAVLAYLSGHDLRVVGLGFSQAVATVCRWAAFGRRRLDRVILWGGAIAADRPTDRGARVFQGASIVMVAGRKDAVTPVKFMQGERARLMDHGVDVEFVEHDGGHALNSDALRRIGASQSSSAANDLSS